MWLAYSYNPGYLLTYLAIAWLLLVFSYSELWAAYVSPVLTHFFFKEDHKNKLLQGSSSHQVRTYTEINQDKT